MFKICAAVVSVFFSFIIGVSAAERRPNVVVFLADDGGWGDLSVNGNTNLSTPNIDSLAKDGAMLDRFFVSPVCSPTRAEFLTGRYHPRSGVTDVTRGGERMNTDEKTIADSFKAAGYATALFGKWHNGMQWPFHPNARGFDEFYGYCSGHWGDYFDAPLEHNGQPVQSKGFMPDDLTDRAIQYIEANRAKPFFCYVAFNTPHSPFQVSDKFYKKFATLDPAMRGRDGEKENVEVTRAALAMTENLDWNVGRVLKRLTELKIADDTIVVYFNDNGPNSWRWNGGMKGKKGNLDEGGVRSPLLIRWPGKIFEGMRVATIAGAIDLLPTLAELAHVPVVSDKPLDGVSFAPMLRGEHVNPPDRMIFSHWNGKVSVRTQGFRLDERGALFDMIEDGGQTKDIATEKPELAAQLSKAVAAWRKDVLATPGNRDLPFPVGYPQFPRTQLPARDGVPHGGIERSARAPNSSYFRNWTTPEESMTWDIEVATAGRYEAVIHYACPKRDVGSTIELSFGESHITTKVDKANEQAERGMEHDRVKREGESYVKDFKPMKIGVIELKSGRGQLTLRAPTVAGAQVMEVRQVDLLLLK